MKIRITMDLYDEVADPDHETGVKELTWGQLMDFLHGYGEDIDIRRDDDE